MTKGLQLVAGTFPIHLATGNIMLLQCACSSGTSVQSQSSGHTNSSCMLFAFVCVASSVTHELGSGSKSNELIFFIRAWNGVDGNSGVLVEHPQVWEDEQQGI